MYNVDIRIDLVDRGVGKDTQIGNEIEEEQYARIELVRFNFIKVLDQTHA